MATDWVNREHAKWNEAESARDVIAANAQPVYDDLWDAILQVLKHPTIKSQFAPTVNGNPLHRKVVNGSKHLTLDLAQDRKSIEARWDASTVRLDFSVAGEMVYLTHEGKRVSYDQAAETILKPFFFG